MKTDTKMQSPNTIGNVRPLNIMAELLFKKWLSPFISPGRIYGGSWYICTTAPHLHNLYVIILDTHKNADPNSRYRGESQDDQDNFQHDSQAAKYDLGNSQTLAHGFVQSWVCIRHRSAGHNDCGWRRLLLHFVLFKSWKRNLRKKYINIRAKAFHAYNPCTCYCRFISNTSFYSNRSGVYIRYWFVEISIIPTTVHTRYIHNWESRLFAVIFLGVGVVDHTLFYNVHSWSYAISICQVAC